jgi:hypothetical protein
LLTAFLTDDDLRQLTGYKKPCKQIEWLRKRGIPHFINARRKPVVSKDLSANTVAKPKLGNVK